MTKHHVFMLAVAASTCAPLSTCHGDGEKIRYRACVWAEEAQRHGIDPRHMPPPPEPAQHDVLILPMPMPTYSR